MFWSLSGSMINAKLSLLNYLLHSRYKISHSKNSLTFVIGVKVREFNATFNNISAISWQSILLVEENGVTRENH